jgi:hypothetical protein
MMSQKGSFLILHLGPPKQPEGLSPLRCITFQANLLKKIQRYIRDRKVR